MLSVPFLGSAKELSKFTHRAGPSVIVAGNEGPGGTPAVFPKELAERISAWSADVKLAVAPPAALEGATGGAVRAHDVFIFADGALCWRSEALLSLDTQSLASEAVTVFISAMLQQSHLRNKQLERYEAIVTRVKLVTLERQLKMRKARAARRAKPPPPVVEDPYTVLGLPQGASFEQVRAARTEMLKQYHPDKVAGLGPKLREVAETETKRINGAFAHLQTQLQPGRRR